MIHTQRNYLIAQQADELPGLVGGSRPNSLRRRLLACLAATAFGVLGVAAAPALAASSTFGYSPGYQYFTVPSSVTSLRFDAIGGAGANGQGYFGGGGSGGSGAELTGAMAVTPGEVVSIWVGGAGQPGGGDGYGNPGHDDFDGGSGGSGYGGGSTTGPGGGGGAASYIKANGNLVAVAGGGGGGGGAVLGGGGGAGSDGGYTGGVLSTNGWDATAQGAGGGDNADGGAANATNSDNGGDGATGGFAGLFGAGGGGGGGGYYTCGVVDGFNQCFSAGSGGGGGPNSGGGGGAGGNSFANAAATGVSFKSSGFSAGTAGQITLTYGVASATTASESSATSPLGQSVRFTAAVDPSDGGGTVTFTSDGTVISGCSNLSFEAGGGTDWLTSCSTSSLPAGTHRIIATYSGDGNYTGSSGATTEIVQQATSSTTVSASSATSPSGQSVTFTASVNPSDGGGNVTFSSDGGSISGCGTVKLAVASGNATARCTTSSLPAGSHTITATYSGDGNYLGSSGSTTETIQPVVQATTTSLTAAHSTTQINVADSLTATVRSSDGAGTLTFTQAGVPLPGCSGLSLTAITGAYKAVCKHTWTMPGTYPILANYSGDTGSGPSSGTATVTVHPAPTVSSVSPNAGPTAGGQTVTINGSYLSGATNVSFGPVVATNVTVVSDSQLTATVPAHAAGTVNVTVTSPLGTGAATSGDRYTYDALPTVSAISPSSGAKGTVVTVSGTGFVAGTKAMFGTVAAAKVVRVSSTALQATAPAGTGNVPVTVSNPGGTSATSAADQFSYTG